jgi:hypothetical protein
MASPEESNLPIVGFRTLGGWTAEDVTLLTASASQIYDVFHSLSIYRESQEQSLSVYFDTIRRFEKYFLHSPESERYYKLLRQWLDLYREYFEKGMPFFPEFPVLPPPPFPFSFPIQPPSFPILSASEIFRDLRRFSVEEDALRIHKVRMASPGGFTFTGIGEIVKEFRELIKDLWFRNRQERQKGQLEVIEKYLSIRQNYPEARQLRFPPPRSERELAQVINQNVNNIRLLEDKGRIGNVGENLDYVED